MDNTPIGVDLTRDPVVTEVEGGRMLTWPGCRAFVPGPLGDRGPAEARPDAAEGLHGAPQETVERLLTRLWPQLESVTTAKELGAVIIDAGVPRRMKFKLACLARDRLSASWGERTLRHWLAPACHTDMRAEKYREVKRAWRADPVNREREREAKQAWYADNPDYANEYDRSRRKTDPAYTLARMARVRVAGALRAARAGKASKTMDLLGCTPQAFKEHLESLWEPTMTWDNYGNGPGLWVVDHVVPVAAFDLTTEDGQRQAFHYTNTVPLAWEENATKSSHHEGRKWTHADHQ